MQNNILTETQIIFLTHANRNIAVDSGGFRGGAVHVAQRQHRVRAAGDQGGQGHASLRLRLLQVRGGLLLYTTHQCPYGFLCEYFNNEWINSKVAMTTTSPDRD